MKHAPDSLVQLLWHSPAGLSTRRMREEKSPQRSRCGSARCRCSRRVVLHLPEFLRCVPNSWACARDSMRPPRERTQSFPDSRAATYATAGMRGDSAILVFIPSGGKLFRYIVTRNSIRELEAVSMNLVRSRVEESLADLTAGPAPVSGHDGTLSLRALSAVSAASERLALWSNSSIHRRGQRDRPSSIWGAERCSRRLRTVDCSPRCLDDAYPARRACSGSIA